MKVMEKRVEADQQDGNIEEVIVIDLLMSQVIIHRLVLHVLGNRIIMIIMTIYLNGM
jgi:hypothetical protein